MRKTNFARTRVLRSEAGQAMLFLLLGLGTFLIGAMALAVDMGNLWFNRQAAQTAADAACTAGAMDLLVGATNGSLPSGANFTAGTAFSCDSKGSPTASPCQYAALNGFNSSLTASQATSGTLGNNVSVSFPSASSYPNFAFPPSSVTSTALIQVTVANNIPTFFAGMLKGLSKQNISASALCGVIQAASPIPILVLNPTVSNAFQVQGTPNIAIVGGPSKSIQVNSVSTSAASFGGASANVNLCAGGNTFCGSSMGVWGPLTSLPGSGQFYASASTCTANRPSGAPACSPTQTAPQFNDPSAPIADPLATQLAPQVPSTTRSGPSGSAAAGTQGCPLTTGNCDVYSPGYYPSGIQVKNGASIFDPGIYYLQGNPGCGGGKNAASFCAQSNSCIRPSTNTGDGSGGTIFYFADTGGLSVVVGSNAGCTGNAAFNLTTGTGSLANGIKCTASSQIPKNLQTLGTLQGSILLAPCQAPTVTSACASAVNPKTGKDNCSLNFGDPLGATDPIGEQRGILFFQDRGIATAASPSWDGGGSSLLAGTIYFHQCVKTGTDTGQGCSSAAYGDQMTLGGNSGSTTYVFGDVIVDQLQLGGTSGITMDLNPSAASTTLKAALLQ